MDAKKIFVFLTMGCFISVTLLMAAGPCFGAIYFLDKKLRAKGSVYELTMVGTNIKKETRDGFRDTRFGLMKTKATLEMLYKAVESPNLELNLFGFFQWWHEAVPDFDNEYKRSISTVNHKRFQGPFFDEDDWINELYVDLYSGPWNIRLGKQIVFWSEVEMVRTIDRINPLDMRYTTPGIDPWDEMKIGLWMMRGFYNSDLPGQLVFEWIWIPGDFEQVRSPTEGTFMGGNPAPPEIGRQPPRAYGQADVKDEMFMRARPAFNLENSSWALRVRGNSDLRLLGETYVLDWTVSWFHGMNNTAVARTKTLGSPSSFNLDPSTLNGHMMVNAIRRLTGRPSPRLPHDSFYRFRFFDAIGASCQTFVPKLKGVLRGEISYEIGLPTNKAFPKRTASGYDSTPANSKPITGNTERDNINIGLTYDRPVRWQWLQDHGGEVIDTSFGLFAQKKLGNITRQRWTFGYYHRHQVNFTFMARTRLNKSEFWPVIRFLYNTRNWGYGAFTMRYTPGKHMRYETGYMWFFANDKWDSPVARAENKDFVYFRIGYEF
jgi:hypothetical protein